MAQPPSNAARVQQALARYPTLDPRAVLAIAAQEGLGGGIGDQGTSFGPFQLHQGGALPSGIPLGGAQQWAWSPAGLSYALSRIAGVAGGLKGAPAISAISTRFERPANPGREIAGAERVYGLPVSAAAGISAGGGRTAGAAPGAASPLAQAAAGISGAQFAQQFAGMISPTGQITNVGGLLGLLRQRGATATTGGR
jgi:hypothetical protein